MHALCRLVWNNGLACIAVASFCSSIGALSVKLLDGRVPVFEIVVSTEFRFTAVPADHNLT